MQPFVSLPTSTEEPTRRHFYRCKGCLSVSAIEVRGHSNNMRGARCFICNDALEHMGEVYRARLVTVGQGCPCDARCTAALGPSCDCQCGGVNHGTNLTVDVIRDQGPIPLLKPKDEAAARAFVSANREALAALSERAEAKFGDDWSYWQAHRTTRPGSSANYLPLYRAWRARTAAQAIKVRSLRLKKLAAVLA